VEVAQPERQLGEAQAGSDSAVAGAAVLQGRAVEEVGKMKRLEAQVRG
jgi:hypothetical protein